MSINTRLLLSGSVDNSSSVKVLEPFQPDIIKCDNKDAFNVIYNANKEKYNAMTTQKLNKIFNIPGYKITKVNNEICLRSIKPCEKINSNDYSDTLQKLTEKVERLTKIIDVIIKVHDELCDKFNQYAANIYAPNPLRNTILNECKK